MLRSVFWWAGAALVPPYGAQNFFDKHLKGADVKIELVPESEVAVEPPKPAGK